MTDFKVGDKVVDVNGNVGIVAIDYGNSIVRVAFPHKGTYSGNDYDWSWDFPHFLVKKLEEPKMAEFKVGDRVRLGEFEGVVTDVIVNDPNRVPVIWDNKCFRYNEIHKDMLTKIRPKFEKGEKVWVEATIVKQGVIDEIPMAYKSIDAVMAAQKDLVKPVAVLKQVLCVKG